MSDECTVSVYDDAVRVQEALHILERGGFPIAQSSVVTKGIRERPETVEELGTGGDDSARNAAIGAGLGGIVGALGGVEMTVILGVGSFFLMGPIGLGVVGSVVGAFLGAMAGWGVHEQRIRHYEELVKHGKTLVIAIGNPLQLIQADRILKETCPLEHHLYAKTSSEASEVNPDENLGTAKVPATGRETGRKCDAIRNQLTNTGEGGTMVSVSALERCSMAVGILADEKGRIKERLLIAYASQWSQINAKDLPADVIDDFFKLRNALSDAEMPYGYGERAATKINALTEDEACSFAKMILRMFIKLFGVSNRSRQ